VVTAQAVTTFITTNVKNKIASDNRAMGSIAQFTKDDIRAIYRPGEDESVTFIWNMLQNYKTLAESIQKLEDQISKNSGKSGKPPSGDGLAKRPVCAIDQRGHDCGSLQLDVPTG
jgi:hypothetical protein